VSLLLVSFNQHGQALAVAAAVLVAAATLEMVAVSAALLVAALALRQPFTVAAFEQRRLSAAAVHTLLAEVSAD
jgi:hypothetical protein